MRPARSPRATIADQLYGLRLLTSMHRRFGAPLRAEHREWIEDRCWQAKEVDQHCLVQCLPRLIAVGFVRWAQWSCLEYVEDLAGAGMLDGAELARVQHPEIRQAAEGQASAPSLLQGTSPPEENQAECRIGPQHGNYFVTALLHLVVGPRPASQRDPWRYARGQTLRVQPEIAVKVEPRGSPPRFVGAFECERNLVGN